MERGYYFWTSSSCVRRYQAAHHHELSQGVYVCVCLLIFCIFAGTVYPSLVHFPASQCWTVSVRDQDNVALHHIRLVFCVQFSYFPNAAKCLRVKSFLKRSILIWICAIYFPTGSLVWSPLSPLNERQDVTVILT